jgi:hypothetical protein
MTEESSRVDVGRTVAEEDGDSAGEGEEYAEVDDMMSVRGIVSYGIGKAVRSQERSYFCKEGVMDVLVEGALATPSANVEHFSSPAIPNRAKQSEVIAAATSHTNKRLASNHTRLKSIKGYPGLTLHKSMRIYIAVPIDQTVKTQHERKDHGSRYVTNLHRYFRPRKLAACTISWAP